MAQYKSGLVTVTNNSNTVTSQANSTFWAANIVPGDIFTIVGDNVWYTVAVIVDDETITLGTVYAGVTQTNTTYTITRDFTPNYSLPYPLKGDIETASVLKRAILDIDKVLGNMIDVKDSVIVATTSSIANLASGPAAIDGVTLSVNDRILVKDTASIDGIEGLSAKRNGIYYVFSVSSSPVTTVLKRSDDANTDTEVTSGMFTFIEQGTTNADSGWILTTENPIVVDTTLLTFSQFTGTGLINAGIALSKTGNTLDVDLGTTVATAAYGNHNHTLDSLSNATITSNSTGEVLKWNGSAWINNTLVEAGIKPDFTENTGFNKNLGIVAGTVSEGSHTHAIDDLTDVVTSGSPGPADGDVLTWNATGSSWENAAATGGAPPAAFNAYMTINQNNIAAGASVPVLFNAERFDEGGDFNTTTYTFTAPQTGNYLLGFEVRLNDIDTGALWYRMQIVTSNKTYEFLIAPKFSVDPLYWHIAGSILADMDINDTAFIEVGQSGGVTQTDIPIVFNTYYGFLVA